MTRRRLAEEKNISGTARKSREEPILTSKVLTPLTVVPSCPDWIKGYGKEEWNRLAPYLVEHEALNALNIHDFGIMCALFGRIRFSEFNEVKILPMQTIQQYRILVNDFGGVAKIGPKKESQDNPFIAKPTPTGKSPGSKASGVAEKLRLDS